MGEIESQPWRAVPADNSEVLILLPVIVLGNREYDGGSDGKGGGQGCRLEGERNELGAHKHVSKMRRYL